MLFEIEDRRIDLSQWKIIVTPPGSPNPPHPPSLHFCLRRALFLDYFHVAQQTSASPKAGFTGRGRG